MWPGDMEFTIRLMICRTSDASSKRIMRKPWFGRYTCSVWVSPVCVVCRDGLKWGEWPRGMFRSTMAEPWVLLLLLVLLLLPDPPGPTATLPAPPPGTALVELRSRELRLKSDAPALDVRQCWMLVLALWLYEYRDGDECGLPWWCPRYGGSPRPLPEPS